MTFGYNFFVHQLNRSIDESMQHYDIPGALKPVMGFIDDASNWYVRRSRKRFWKTENDSDKNQAYATLHYVLTQLSILLAPFVPFLSEELYRLLCGGESVHLLEWPKAGVVDETLIETMGFVRDIINEGLRQRAEAGIKVRQPLNSVTIHDTRSRLTKELQGIIAEELNVKKIEVDAKESELPVVVDLRITPDLKREGLAREIIRNVQNARKNAGLNVDDRIDLELGSDSGDLVSVYEDKQLQQAITKETLAVSFNQGELGDAYSELVKVEGMELGIKLKVAAN